MTTFQSRACVIITIMATCGTGAAADRTVAIVSRLDTGPGSAYRTFELDHVVGGILKTVNPLGGDTSYGITGNFLATVAEQDNRTDMLTLWQMTTGRQINQIPVKVRPLDTLTGAPPPAVAISSDMSIVYVTGRYGNAVTTVLYKITLANRKCEEIPVPHYKAGCAMLSLPDGFGIYLPGGPLYLYSTRMGKFLPEMTSTGAYGYVCVPEIGILGWDRSGSVMNIHGPSVDDTQKPADLHQHVGLARWAFATKWGVKVAVFGTGHDNAGSTEVTIYDPQKDAVVATIATLLPIVSGISSTEDRIDLLSWDGKVWRLTRPANQLEKVGDLGITEEFARQSILVAAN